MIFKPLQYNGFAQNIVNKEGVRVLDIQTVPKDPEYRYILSQIFRIEGYKGDIHFRELSRNQSSHHH